MLINIYNVLIRIPGNTFYDACVYNALQTLVKCTATIE